MPIVDHTKLGFKGPLLFTGFFKQVLQQHFSSPDALFDSALATTLWKPTNHLTEQTAASLYIENKLKPDPAKANFRPAILIQRGSWSKRRFSFNDAADTSGSPFGAKLAFWEGTHSFDCINTSCSQAETLAYEVATFFTVYSEWLSAALCCNWILVTTVSEPSILEGSKPETFSVTVSIEYSLTNTWMLQSSRPKLRHIFLGVNNKSDFENFVSNTINQ
jgi:hypothetical protein